MSKQKIFSYETGMTLFNIIMYIYTGVYLHWRFNIAKFWRAKVTLSSEKSAKHNGVNFGKITTVYFAKSISNYTFLTSFNWEQLYQLNIICWTWKIHQIICSALRCQQQQWCFRGHHVTLFDWCSLSRDWMPEFAKFSEKKKFFLQ